MKPIVSSIVALAIAVTPLTAFAKPAHPSKASTSVVQKSKGDKGDKGDKGSKHEASGKQDKPAIAASKSTKKDVMANKHAAKRPNDGDIAGAGHAEPKVDRDVFVSASLKSPQGKSPVKNAAAKSPELPPLPSAKSGKPGKGGAEKGARKPAHKKSESADDSGGERSRDEDLAELVARIRGHVDEAAHLTSPGRASGKLVRASHVSTPTCFKAPVEIVRGPEVETFELTTCDGSVAPLAVERLSVLARPGGAARPTAPLEELAKKFGAELSPGVRRVDERLVSRLQALVDHFARPPGPVKFSVVSGYRPASVGSMHASGRAIDLRVEGVRNEDVVAFCKTLPDMGCGYYPNSSFVHIDVRDAGSGHVTWIDASGPGETPRYVAEWPPKPAEQVLERASLVEPATEELAAEGAALLRAARPVDAGIEDESADDHPAEASP